MLRLLSELAGFLGWLFVPRGQSRASVLAPLRPPRLCSLHPSVHQWHEPIDGAGTVPVRPYVTTCETAHAQCRIGEVRELFEGSAYLVPPGGGAEWTVSPAVLRSPTDGETWQARVWTPSVGSL